MSYSEHGLTVGCVWAKCKPVNLSLSNRARKLYSNQVTIMPESFPCVVKTMNVLELEWEFLAFLFKTEGTLAYEMKVTAWWKLCVVIISGSWNLPCHESWNLFRLYLEFLDFYCEFCMGRCLNMNELNLLSLLSIIGKGSLVKKRTEWGELKRLGLIEGHCLPWVTSACMWAATCSVETWARTSGNHL